MIYSDFLNEAELQEYTRSINARARSSGAQGEITVDALRDRILESGGRCDWCASRLVQQPFEVDHVVSLREGGRNTADNLAIACPDCNRAKAAKHPLRFAQETYARTATMTRLLRRLLDQFDATAFAQRSLFDAPSQTPRSGTEPDDDPPPYIWKRG
jgi:hypothetical protein